jgi:hypothetical protein
VLPNLTGLRELSGLEQIEEEERKQMANKPKETSKRDLKKIIEPVTTTSPLKYTLNKTVTDAVQSTKTVQDNPRLLVDWAKESPVAAAGLTGLAVGSYVGYSQKTGEYKIPGYEFKTGENTSVKVEGGIGLDGDVKSAGMTFRWKF